jgi:hypothetical protein
MSDVYLYYVLYSLKKKELQRKNRERERGKQSSAFRTD